MQKAENTSRFVTGDSSKAEFSESGIIVTTNGFLRRIIAGRFSEAINSADLFLTLTNELSNFAEHAYVMRDLTALEDASDLLTSLPVDVARQIGSYYHALAINRQGRRDEAETLFEEISCNGPILYRARAIQTLGANYLDRGQPYETLRFQLEALQAASARNANSLLTTVKAHFEIAVLKSIAGDHKGSLTSFGKLWPLVHCVLKEHPFYFYLYQNGLAVELAAAGRLAEAEAACAVALASPFAHAYPEWSETRNEIAAKRQSASPSVVAIRRPLVSQVAPQAKSQRDSEPNAKPRANSRRNPNLVIRFAFSYPASHKDFFQRSVFPIPAKKLTVLNAASILEQMLICIGPRAPPLT